jgi:hypothetical protein
MALGLHFFENVRNYSIFVDHESGSRDAPINFSIIIFFDPDAIFFGDGVIGVGEEGEIEMEFLGEVGDVLDGVGADAKDDGVGQGVLGGGVAEGAGFGGAAGGVGFGVEEEDDGLIAGEIVERDGLVIASGEFEFRGGGADGGDGGHFISPNGCCERMNRSVGGGKSQCCGRRVPAKNFEIC